MALNHHGADEFDALVGDREAFFRTNWERWPLHRRSSLDASRLLSVDAIDELLTSSALLWPVQIRLAKDGAVLDPSSFTAPVQFPGMADPPLIADPGAVVRQFLDGASVMVQGMQRIWPAIGDLCDALDRALTHGTSVTAFLTPPRKRGLPRHADPYDVFVIQVAGRKRWTLHAPDPALTANGGVDDRRDRGAPDLEVELEPDDVLYLPQGWLHCAESLDEVSLHVSVMVEKRRWRDVVTEALSQLALDPMLDEPLPCGYAGDDRLAEALRDRLDAVAERLRAFDAHALAREVREQFWRSRRPNHRGQLVQALSAHRIGDETLVRATSGTRSQFGGGADGAALVRGDHTITLPSELAPCVQLLGSGSPVMVADLDAPLPDGVRLALARELVRQGFCEVVDPTSGTS